MKTNYLILNIILCLGVFIPSVAIEKPNPEVSYFIETSGKHQNESMQPAGSVALSTVTLSTQISDTGAIQLPFQTGTKAAIKPKNGPRKNSCIKKKDTDNGIIRVLAIGNSFSEDALEHYFHGLAAAAGIKLIIGHLYIGGSSLAMHWENASQNKKAYEFREIGIDGHKTITADKSIAEVVSATPWDYISMQQVSYLTGLFDTYKVPFPKLYDYIKSSTIQSNVKMVFHQIWAYQQGSGHSEFDNYNNDQMTMYRAIVDAVWRANELRDIDIIVPSGTAIQNGRATRIGDHFTRDTYHLNHLGQYTAACTWFEAIFRKNIIGNTFAPKGLSPEQIEIAQHVAHAAVAHPKQVTILEKYKPLPDKEEGAALNVQQPGFIHLY